MAPPVVGVQQRPVRLLLWLTLLHALALLLFARGFLLTRVELPHTSPCGQQCQEKQQYDKAVVLIIDALRHDFVCAHHGSAHKQPHQGLFSQTLELLAAAGDSATVLKFVADTPTITMSRLKALLTGGLPTFLDVGKSFSASTVTEDNLVAQLLTQKRRLAFMGDDTWMQLVPGAFVEAHPYPSFNVKDLHTVDDGVWQHLLAALDRPGDWDVLIGHYLGVDHAGHTHGVASQQMTDKVMQMDGQVAHILHKLAAAAGPGGPYEHALLLVMGDHGQAMGGDHGGGSADETDSVLIAASLGKLHAALQRQREVQEAKQQSAHLSADQLLPQQQEDSATAFLQQLLADQATSSVDAGGLGGSLQSGAAASSSSQLVCRHSIPQVDLTPTLAALLGVGMPYGNIGRVAPELWSVLGSSAGKGGLLASYQGALWDNAQQVHTYLNSYAEVASLPAKDLAHCNALFEEASAAAAQAAAAAAAAATAVGEAGTAAAHEAALLEGIKAQLAFLEAAAALARAQFTQFHQPMIWAGSLAAAAVLAYQLLLCRRALRSAHGTWTLESRALAVLAALHALCLFSVGALMGEGRLQCYLAAALALLVLRATLSASLSARAAARRHRAADVQSVGAAAPGQPPLPAAKRTIYCDARACITCTTASMKPGDKAAADPSSSTGQTDGTMCSAMLAKWAGPQQGLLTAGLGLVLLACGAALQAWGLIDRSGQDPHDKTQMNQELLGAAGGGGQWWRQLASIQAPLAAIVALLLACDCWLAALVRTPREENNGDGQQLLRGTDPVGEPGSRVLQGLHGVAVSAAVAEYACISAWWLAHRWGMAEESLQGLAAAWVGGGPGSAGAMLLRALPAGDAVSDVLAPLLRLPLRLLLPRAVYLLALLVLCLFMAVAAMAACRNKAVSATAKQGDGSGACTVSAVQTDRQRLGMLARALLGLAASFSGPVVMVLGFRGPWVMLMVLLQGMGLVALMAMHNQAQQAVQQLALQPCSSSSGTAGNGNKAHSNGAGGIDGAAQGQGSSSSGSGVAPAGSMFSNGVGPGVWAMYALQLFFCSGHFCEFTGLQYSSSFIGFDDVVWVASGALLLLNTFGFLMLGCLSLPVLVAVGMLIDGDQTRGTKQAASLSQSFSGALAGALLVGNSMRFAGLGVSIVSAAIQQRHILLWAIFAPKLVFEALFVAVTDCFQLLTAWLACSLLAPP